MAIACLNMFSKIKELAEVGPHIHRKGNAFNIQNKSSRILTWIINCGTRRIRKITQSRYEIWPKIMPEHLLRQLSRYNERIHLTKEIDYEECLRLKV